MLLHSKTLLIDLGNSNLKWGLDSSQGFVFGGSCESAPAALEQLFSQQFNGLRPDNIFVSCVGHRELWQRFYEKAKSKWQIDAKLMVTPKEGDGIYNAYRDAEKLGSDRWAGMVAAFVQTKGSVCVVSAGTAITLDVVDSTGLHRGGLIIPGYGLMQSGLKASTNIEFSLDVKSSTHFELGQSTETCISQGITAAIDSMVARVFEQLQSELSKIDLILTGGDAEILQNQLSYESSVEPYLVLKGMAVIHRSGVTG